MKPKILSNVAFFKNFLFFQTFLKLAGTGSHPELHLRLKAWLLAGYLKNIEATF